MASFQDLGLREPLLAALEDAGLERPTGLQQAVIPVLRREGNVVARAASGAGKTLAYGLGVLDRLSPRDEGAEEEEEDATEANGGEGGGVRVLVLSPTPEAAARAALELVPYAQSVGLTVAASGGGWGTPSGQADVLAAPAAEVMEAVRTSGIKLDAVEAIVVDGAAEIETLGGWEALETLFDHVPRDAQRVIVTSRVTDGVEDLAGRRVKRALRWPPEAAVPDAHAEAATGRVVGYVPVAAADKVDVVSRLLGGERGGEAAPVLFCRTDERAAQLAEALALRGFLVGEMDDPDTDVAVVGGDADALAEETGEQPHTAISYDVPADEETLRARHGGETTGFVLVEPRELPHLRDIAKRAGFSAQPAGIQGEEPTAASAALRAFRGELRRALREEDLAAQMLILEPLFEDFTPVEVAAAASALLRRRAPAAAAQPAQDTAAAPAARAPRTAPSLNAPTGTAPATFARLFVSIGERDGVRAGDLVGAIAGEANIPGSSIGKVEIRDTFSIVEVPGDAAARVIQALNGTSMKGRSLRVDYDRPRAPAGRGPGGGRGPGSGGPRGGFGDRPRGPGGGSRGPGGPRSGGGPRGGGDRPDRGPVRRPPRP